MYYVILNLCSYSVTSQVPGQRDENSKLNNEDMIMFSLARAIIAEL